MDLLGVGAVGQLGLGGQTGVWATRGKTPAGSPAALPLIQLGEVDQEQGWRGRVPGRLAS